MQLFKSLRLPLIAAPMFLVSGPELVIASSLAGIVGSFPTQNARTTEILRDWLAQISDRLGRCGADLLFPWAANLVTHPSYNRRDSDFESLLEYRPPLVISALGSPVPIIDQVHAYGGLVFADVNNIRLARKAVDAGVDGLILVGSGSGGHTGALTGFAFVAQVRQFWQGPLALAGGMCDGRAIRACEVMGADMAVMGTRFIATHESNADPGYRQMLIEASAEDLVVTNAFTGVHCNMLKPSIRAAGYDPDQLDAKAEVNFSDPLNASKAWRDIWSAGQGVGLIDKVQSVAALVDELETQYQCACAVPRWNG